MNSQYIILAILAAIIVVGAVFLLRTSPAEAPIDIDLPNTNQTEENDANTDTDPIVPDESMDMNEEEADMPTGSDVGMDATGEAMITPDAVIDISGENFAFSQKEIRVNEGDTVRVNFTSTGGFHDWVIEAFDARTAHVNEGETSSVVFVADRTGSFEYYCSVGSHRQLGMVGTLIVE